MDILQALAAQPKNGAGNKTCVVQRWLDEIDDETPGKTELIAAITTTDKRDPSFRTRQAVALILSRLGFDTTVDTIGDHRGGRCRCFY